MKEILVDEEGYQQFLNELQSLQQLLSNNASGGSEAYSDAVGDGWHDNFAFEEAVRQNRNISNRIEKMLIDKQYLKIVDDKNGNSKKVSINDVVALNVKYEDDDVQEFQVKLTGKYIPDAMASIQEVSLNSPIGKSIYNNRFEESFLKFR